MFLCEILLASSSSCLKRAETEASTVMPGRISLRATVRSSSVSYALYTAPMPPSPSRHWILYRGPKLTWGAEPVSRKFQGPAVGVSTGAGDGAAAALPALASTEAGSGASTIPAKVSRAEVGRRVPQAMQVVLSSALGRAQLGHTICASHPRGRWSHYPALGPALQSSRYPKKQICAERLTTTQPLC